MPGITVSVPLTHKLQVLPGHFGLIVPRDNGQGEESSYLHEEVTLISRRGHICFYTVEADYKDYMWNPDVTG